MRCLLLSPFLPAPATDGGRVRVAELAGGLVARGHEVHLLALAEPGPTTAAAAASLAGPGLRVETVAHRPDRKRAALDALRAGRSLYGTLYRSPAFAARLAVLLDERRFDVVQCEFSYMAQYRTGRLVPWVLDEHNVEHRINERIEATGAGGGLRGAVYRRYATRERALRRDEELAACRAADRVVAVSDVDRDQLLELDPALPVTVVPNGVDLDAYRPAPAPVDPLAAVFVGKMDYRPNADGVTWFCREILPLVRRDLPGFTLTVVGGNPTREVTALGELPGVRVTGRVPDTRPYLRDAAVALVPLRAGSGTRLKVLEAMAAGRAVVSTTIGAEGLAAVDGRHLLLTDTPADFAARTVALLGDPTRRDRLARAGRELVEQRYGWQRVVADLERVLLETVTANIDS